MRYKLQVLRYTLQSLKYNYLFLLSSFSKIHELTDDLLTAEKPVRQPEIQ